MQNQRWRSPGLVAAGVVAGGILAGTIGAHAADTTPDGDRPPHVMMHRHGGPDSAGLAKALGVSQKKLDAAFQAVHDDLRPAKPPTGPPSGGDRAAMESKFSAALAKELGLSSGKVESALAAARTQEQADHRAELATRLDTAVSAGTLTSDDKASVLKAFDAGILGPPRPGDAQR